MLPLSLRHGSHGFEIAGVRFSIEVSAEPPLALEMPGAFGAFLVGDESPREVTISVGAACGEVSNSAPVVFESRLNWRLRQEVNGLSLECYHRPSSAVLLWATSNRDGGAIDVRFASLAWSRLRQTTWRHLAGDSFFLLPPVDQLLFLPPLVRRDVFLVHAGAAVLDGRAHVFAGHSGDGKTTLARMLASEGIELLSDERVAIRRQGGRFYAYGTPWPGEGEVVSAAGHPLAAVYLLNKASRHSVLDDGRATAVTELMSRSLVPYYLEDETRAILDLVRQLGESVPLRRLYFAREPGLLELLRENLTNPPRRGRVALESALTDDERSPSKWKRNISSPSVT